MTNVASGSAGNVASGSAEHEQVVRLHDRATGLVGFIAIHSTALGPALGGTRFLAYATEADAEADALRLARAMSYKNALAGLDHGGGKAVLMGDPSTKTEAKLEAYGRFVEALGGRYVTACDSGTQVADMDVVARTSRWVTGRSVEQGGAGDSAVLTALGVFRGMQAAAQVRWGRPTLGGRTVGICGVGKVGTYLVGHLLDDGAKVIVTDIDDAAVVRIVAAHPSVAAAPDEGALLASTLDVYSPCALGGALDERTVTALTAEIICGAANNQLADPSIADELARREVLYVPDFVVNSGGVIQVADELKGFSLPRATAKTEEIFQTTLTVLAAATANAVTPAAAADRLAEVRMNAGPWATTLFPGAANRVDAPTASYARSQKPLP